MKITRRLIAPPDRVLGMVSEIVEDARRFGREINATPKEIDAAVFLTGLEFGVNFAHDHALDMNNRRN